MSRAQKLTPIPVTERIRFIEIGVPLQKVFEKEFKKLPEFEFYQLPHSGRAFREWKYNMEAQTDFVVWPKDISHYEQYRKMKYDDSLNKPTAVLSEIKDRFRNTRDEAKEFENKKNFKAAADAFEWLIAQQYPLPYAHDRLIKIYKDHGLIKDAIDVANEGINFFTQLRTRQSNYVGRLAKKYGALDYFLDRINNKQKVFYYGGSFELYNPYNIIDKWKVKLEKLKAYAAK